MSIPVAAGLLAGEQPHGVQLAGIVVAFAGAILASGPELRGEQQVKQQAVWFALAAAVGFGVTMLAIARGAASSTMFTMVGMRTTSVIGFAVAAVLLRSVGGVTASDLPKLALLGLGTSRRMPCSVSPAPSTCCRSRRCCPPSTRWSRSGWPRCCCASG